MHVAFDGMDESQYFWHHPDRDRQRTGGGNAEEQTTANLNVIVDAVEYQVSPR